MIEVERENWGENRGKRIEGEGESEGETTSRIDTFQALIILTILNLYLNNHCTNLFIVTFN